MEKKKFQQTIVAVYVFKNGTVVVFDEEDRQMPFFQGPQDIAMRRVKRRIEKQRPCSIEWKIQEGANFAGESGVMKYE